jgi:BirA family transcriptional regulator, biotin operon repressor / biotin---[acetyl-CoA-carboxylase] ligase
MDTPTGTSTANDPYLPLDVAAISAAVRDLRLGHPLVYFPAIASTNTHAFELARDGAAEGTLVTTDDQTAGRGRIGRVWKSLPGQQLALSLVLQPEFPPHFLVMASALAVAGSIEETTGLAAGIKWPNDVQIEGRKVCGILIETSADFAVVGIGLNVNGSLDGDAELAARATTLAEAAGHPIAREALAAALLRRLDALYAELQTGGEAAQRRLRAEWRSRLVTIGRRVTLRQGQHEVSGLAEDVNADGGLLLRHDDGTLQTVTWGDVDA